MPTSERPEGAGPRDQPGDGRDLERARALAVAAAREAGEAVHERFHGDLKVQAKGSSGDLVTGLDVLSEKLILERLRTAYPSDRVISEEAGILEGEAASPAGGGSGGDAGGAAAAGGGEPGRTWTWVVDPLDGTNNVAIGLPAYVVGIALCADRDPVLGVVHDPVAGRTWSAIRGRGTLGPDETCLVTPPRPVHPAGPLLAWTQGHGVGRGNPRALRLRHALEAEARRVLQLWAPLMCWVMLARGDIDGFVAYEAEAVDLPAGYLIAAEAGVSVRRLDGTPFDDRLGLPDADRSYVAGRPEAMEALLDLVARSGVLG
ncbi:inositol monophosphatase family protein [Allostreptomyces psammosilenae]|uniref:Myo-inositol-1(Or 4)-monophosphatase n=1 Tax=Allostreptomyces psammosilenae TaxID=1892865 RepID=A0A853A166_9ACTN|nr:inositol monophosphatase [Allostreptomyces psammosilenae]NYI08306.1 myo-inositol-1(or 4)-monophosphatase [Allostreptomyces psammosilenae]